jgi:hypothetical protein
LNEVSENAVLRLVIDGNCRTYFAALEDISTFADDEDIVVAA